LEFDASVKGAHTIPYKSKQLKGLKITLQSVTDTKPGQNPKVLFNVAENSGQKLDPNTLTALSFIFSGPTTDYSTQIQESALGKAVASGDSYLYTFQGKIPEAAQGSFSVGVEAYRNVKLNEGTVNETQFRETAENPVVVVAVTDTTPVPRRQVVADEKCEKCHENLAEHSTRRHDAGNYCVMCHTPDATDEARRPQAQLPAQSRHFKFMIHRIHRGHELNRDFTLWAGSAHNYNELRFPGDLRDCRTCHVDDSYQIPLPAGVLPTIAPREFMSVIQPVAGACLGCHDTMDAAAHAATMTAPFGESCAACHGPGAEFAIEKVHAR
jgi:OmcA/MtrC family decaheme c-type cytochrome